MITKKMIPSIENINEYTKKGHRKNSKTKIISFFDFENYNN